MQCNYNALPASTVQPAEQNTEFLTAALQPTLTKLTELGSTQQQHLFFFSSSSHFHHFFYV